MGGAQRNQRNRTSRNTQAARAVASARGASSGSAKWIAAGVAVVVIAAAIIGGVLLANSNKQKQANDIIRISRAQVSYPVKAHDGIVTAGKDSAKAKLDFYEDYLCPACGQFNHRDADKIDKALANGQIQVNYTMMPFLNQNSDPPGYSGRAAAAAYAVAVNAPDKWASYEHSLYNDQPEEHSAGYTNDQLISLGKRLGVGGNFEQDVRSGKYMSVINNRFKKAVPIMEKVDHGNVATPTVVHKGKAVNVNNTQWLQQVIQQSQG